MKQMYEKQLEKLNKKEITKVALLDRYYEISHLL